MNSLRFCAVIKLSFIPNIFQKNSQLNNGLKDIFMYR